MKRSTASGSSASSFDSSRPGDDVVVTASAAGASDTTPEQLASLVGERNFALLRAWGGATGVAARLGCEDTAAGLPAERAAANRERFGRNELPPREVKSFLDHLIEALEDKTLRILIFSAACSILFGAWPAVDASSPWSVSRWRWGARPEELV